jgi:hypothetical protein
MDTYGTNLGERYAVALLEKYYETTVQDKITNSDYEKLLSEGGASVIKVKTLGDVTISDYTGANLTVEDPTESEGELDPDQQKAYYFRIKSLSQFEDYIKNPGQGYIDRATKQLQAQVDTFTLGLYADIGSGNRVGTDYVTGTVTVTVTTGAVTGSGTTFTSAMVGLGFKANGHTKWYRITAYTSATAIVISNDSDDDSVIYDGGAIGAGAAYIIEAATVLTVTSSTIVGYVDKLAEKLDEAQVPKTDRWIVVNAKIAHLIKLSTEFTPAVETAYQDVRKKGLIGEISGLTVYQNQQVAGNNTTGYYILAGHVSAITFYMEYKETGIEPLIGNFGQAYKGLIVYGAKILDERRKALAYAWVKV